MPPERQWLSGQDTQSALWHSLELNRSQTVVWERESLEKRNAWPAASLNHTRAFSAGTKFSAMPIASIPASCSRRPMACVSLGVA